MPFSHQCAKTAKRLKSWFNWTFCLTLLSVPVHLEAATVSFPECEAFSKATDLGMKKFDLSVASKPIDTWDDGDFSAFERHAIECYESGYFQNITEKRFFVDYLADVTSSLREIQSETAKNAEQESDIAEIKREFETLDLESDHEGVDKSLKELKDSLSKIKSYELDDPSNYLDLHAQINSATQQRKQSKEDSLILNKLTAISNKIDHLPATQDGLKKLEHLKDEWRMIRGGSSDDVSLESAKVHKKLQSKDADMRATVREESCREALADLDLDDDQLHQRIAVPYYELTLGEFICAAKNSGTFVEYDGPSFFGSSHTIETKSITLTFHKRKVGIEGAETLVLTEVETGGGSSSPSDIREAMLATDQAYAALKAAEKR